MNKLEPKLKESFGINVKRRQVVNIGQGEFSNSIFNGRKRCTVFKELIMSSFFSLTY
jgi:hypothetical protein